MAQTGTLTEVRTTYGNVKVTITAVTNTSNSPSFTLYGYPFTSYQLTGTAGVGFSGQWQGSNDGGTTWSNLGTATTTLPANGTLTSNRDPYELYRFNVTAGDGTTSVNSTVLASGGQG